VDDILKRLGNVETYVVDLKTQVASIAANMPHLATAASVSDLRTEMANLRTELLASDAANKEELMTSISANTAELSRIAAIIPHLATAASVTAMENRMIRWFIGTAITLTTLAFSIAKLVH
jgi:hypothetical protein